MAIPVVAIIGRPNVGKSSLLNSLSGRMISIVDPTAGVTRDRVSTILEYNERYFELVDTGGYGIVDSDALESHVENQIFQAISQATLVLFVVDIREGITPLDKQILLLRKQPAGWWPTADSPATSAGRRICPVKLCEPIRISAANLINRAHRSEHTENALEHRSKKNLSRPDEIAIVGKRNAGRPSSMPSSATSGHYQ